jgi:hypothetical protein
MSAYRATLFHGEHEAGTRRFYERRGSWKGSHKELAHITVLELLTVRLALKAFLGYFVLRENEVVKLYTDNMVVMYVLNQGVSKSPAIMAELRRLHQFCKRHGVGFASPSVGTEPFRRQIVEAEESGRLSPVIDRVPDHWWVGDSEHDFKLDWDQMELLRPPLEMLPLVPRKFAGTGFRYW